MRCLALLHWYEENIIFFSKHTGFYEDSGLTYSNILLYKTGSDLFLMCVFSFSSNRSESS